jgi:hypothetical protein
MLDRGADEMCFPALQPECRQAEDRQIVALGGSAGKHYLASAGPNHLRDLVTCLFDGTPGAKAVVMRPASGVPEFFGEISKNLFLHARIDGRRRGTIKIDWTLSPVQGATYGFRPG